MDQSYIGDGVYVEHDGYQIWLGLDKGQRVIALDPAVFDELVKYREFLIAKVKDNAPSS